MILSCSVFNYFLQNIKIRGCWILNVFLGNLHVLLMKEDKMQYAYHDVCFYVLACFTGYFLRLDCFRVLVLLDFELGFLLF